MGIDIPEAGLRLGAALAIGLMIGLERGWRGRDLAEGSRVAGFRTFGLIGLLGGLAATIAHDLGTFVVAAGFLSVALGFAVAQWHDPRRDTDVSITTNIAALTAFGLGALAGTGAVQVAVAAAVVTTLLLGFKPELHHLLERIDRAELLATFRLLLISVVVLPILPDEGMGPWKALNPYRLWWMVVLVAGISYAGYFAIRLIGARRGILVTAILGGLVTSTATVLSLSRQAAQRTGRPDPWISGMLAATATMFPRTLLIAAVVAPEVTASLAVPMLSAALIAAVAAAIFARMARDGEDGPAAGTSHANPLDIKTAVQFALVLAVVMVLAQALKQWMGAPGLYLLSAVSGLIDIDAVTLSLATMTENAEITAPTASAAILLASIVNTLVKPAIAFAVAGPSVGFRLLAPLLLIVAVIAVQAYALL